MVRRIGEWFGIRALAIGAFVLVVKGLEHVALRAI